MSQEKNEQTVSITLGELFGRRLGSNGYVEPKKVLRQAALRAKVESTPIETPKATEHWLR